MIKILLGKSLKEVRKSFQRQEELEKEIKELRFELEMITKEFDKQKTVQKKKSDELNKKVQACNEWIKDTREKMWDDIHYGRELDGKIQKSSEWIKDTREKMWAMSSEVQKNNEWIKDTREKMWAMSSDISNLRGNTSKLQGDVIAQKKRLQVEFEKLEYKQKRYCPEEKYELAISDWYREKTGRDIDIKHPKTFNELIQWAKIHDNTEDKSRLSDKYAVREWIKEKIGEQYLIPLLGVWDKAEDIDFDQLPDSFVLKCNHGSAYNIIVKDKAYIDEEKVRKQLNDWLHEDFAFKGFEVHYTRIKPRIIAEKYMLAEGMDDLPDYKFFCFGGKVFCSFTIDNIKEKHSDGRLGIFDRNYNLMPYCRKDFKPITEQLEKPANYDRMVELAEKLAEGFAHVRVDLYNIDGKIYFGEMTFTTANGRGFFEPEEFDYILGKEWLKYLPELW